MKTVRLALLLALVTACGSPQPERATVTMPLEPTRDAVEAGAIERWVAGTPTYVYGEGYVAEHRMAASLDGPWHTAAIELGEGMELQAGQLHRIRLLVRDRSGRMDGPATALEVMEVLESRNGGPPTAVYPGMLVAGISVADIGERDGVSWGPFRFEGTAIEFRVSDVGPIRVGDQTLGGDATLAEVVAAFDGCERTEEGVDAFLCRGARVTSRGAHVDVAIASDS